MLFVEPAGAAQEVFSQGFKNLFYAAPAVANDHYNYLAEHILALPAGQRPKPRPRTPPWTTRSPRARRTA